MWKIAGCGFCDQAMVLGRPAKISATTARKIVWDAKKHPQAPSTVHVSGWEKWSGCFRMHNKEVLKQTQATF